MNTVTLQDAQIHLVELVHKVAPGDLLIITENDRPVARLEAVSVVLPRRSPPRPPVTGTPRAGSLKGLFVVPDDFAESLDELREYME
jgi:antitoxin (DNA-binding transcriptional repressor) of toxin-antitoxin stability system